MLTADKPTGGGGGCLEGGPRPRPAAREGINLLFCWLKKNNLCCLWDLKANAVLV